MKAHNHNEPILVVELAHKAEFTNEVQLTLMMETITGSSRGCRCNPDSI